MTVYSDASHPTRGCIPREVGGWWVGRQAYGVRGSGFRVQDSGARVQGSGFRVQGPGFRVQGAGFRVQGSGWHLSDGVEADDVPHVETLIIYKLGFNHNYHTFALILLITIVMCSKFH